MNRYGIALLFSSAALSATGVAAAAKHAKIDDAPLGAPPEIGHVPEPEEMPRLPEGLKLGPTKIDLGHDLTLDLPAGDVYFDPTRAKKLLEESGSFHNDSILGLVGSLEKDSNWFVTIDYTEEGYVKDDEKVDADAILKAMREGTEEENKERVEKGFSALTIDGWSEPPKYERDLHHLVWALKVSDKEGTSINFNTRVLGRKGYVSLNLVTPPEKFDANRVQAANLLTVTQFGDGARYQDFKPKTDKIAEYGLVGLIAGGAALKLAKIGLIAKFGKVIFAFLLAAKKAIIALFVAVAAFFRRKFGGKKAPAAAVAGASPLPSDPPVAPPSDSFPPTV